MSNQLMVLLGVFVILVLGVLTTAIWLIRIYVSQKIMLRTQYDTMLNKFVSESGDQPTLEQVIARGVIYYDGLKEVNAARAESSLYSVQVDVYNNLKQYSDPYMLLKTADDKLEVLTYLHKNNLISDSEFNTYRSAILSKM